jgi:hypothetical protein
MTDQIILFPVLTMDAVSGPNWESSRSLSDCHQIRASNCSLRPVAKWSNISTGILRIQPSSVLPTRYVSRSIAPPHAQSKFASRWARYSRTASCTGPRPSMMPNLRLEKAFIKDMWTLIFTDDPTIMTQMARCLGTTQR